MVNREHSRKEHWKDMPEEHDYPAAADYLALVLGHPHVEKIISNLRKAEVDFKKAKDILRASQLRLLPPENQHVAKDLKSVKDGEKLSPVLLVRGDASRSIPLTIADGYHRVCASYYLDEDSDIPCIISDIPD